MRAALEILEDSEVTEVSVRAAVAAVGYRELAGALIAAHPAPATTDDKDFAN